MVIVEARCPQCSGVIRVATTMLTRTIPCPACGRIVYPSEPKATATGYEISFADFVGLVNDPRLRQLLHDWFGHEVEAVEAEGTHAGVPVTVRSSSGVQIDPFDLHQEIQRDPDRQGTIYRLAMSIWHG